MKVKFTMLIDKYEKGMKSLKTKKYKEQYIGQTGIVIKKTVYAGNENLYEVKFPDGQVWCLEKEQFEIVSE